MICEIPLSRGYVALVDDQDYELAVRSGPWHVRIDHHLRYAKHSVDSRRTVFLHQILTGWDLVDHANGDGLDNRRANLRPATKSQNNVNARLRSNHSSGYRGVHLHANGRWVANAGRTYLGLYLTAEMAARAYDAAALARFGEFARLNFPKEIQHAIS